jgi:hypothetical protein
MSVLLSLATNKHFSQNGAAELLIDVFTLKLESYIAHM